MQFGWLTLSLSPSPDEDAQRIDNLIDQACSAERLGFSDVWLTEHYFTGESVYSELADVRRRARHEDRARPHRLRRGADAVPPSGAARRAARPARQSQQGPHRRRHRQGHGLQRVRVRRPRAAQHRQPRAHGRGGRHHRARLARGAAQLRWPVPQGPYPGHPAQARAAARPAAVALGDLAGIVQGMRAARRADLDGAAARRAHQGTMGDLRGRHRRRRPR